MPIPDPMNIPKDQLKPIMERIKLPDSPVGIDAGYTHAIIITYLQQISARLDSLEKEVASLKLNRHSDSSEE